MNVKIILIVFSIIIGFFIIGFFIKPLMFKPELNCSDGTLYGACSNNQPLYCFNGTLIDNSSWCGCDYDFKKVGNCCEKIKRCNDNTIYLECSETKPLYCFEGNLIDKASKCGCPVEFIEQGDECVSIYKLSPLIRSYDYVFKGEKFIIEMEVYGSLNDYLAELSKEGWYKELWKEFIFKNLEEPNQQEGLQQLVSKIQGKSNYQDDQARIAISLVQNIPYDDNAVGINKTELRYPYETLYDNFGVCGDKSILLAYLLKELGYGVVTFDYLEHRSVGIKCSDIYDYLNTGYCFIETNNPNIITNSELRYGDEEDFSKLLDPEEIVYISNGTTFDALEEYEDLRKLNKLEKELEDYEEEYEDYEEEYEDYEEEYEDYEELMEDLLELYREDPTSSNYEAYSDAYDTYLAAYKNYEDSIEDYNDAIEDYNGVLEDMEKINKKYGVKFKE